LFQLVVNLLIEFKQLVLQFLLFLEVTILWFIVKRAIQDRCSVRFEYILVTHANDAGNFIDLRAHLFLSVRNDARLPLVAFVLAEIDAVDDVAGEEDEEEARHLQEHEFLELF